MVAFPVREGLKTCLISKKTLPVQPKPGLSVLTS